MSEGVCLSRRTPRGGKGARAAIAPPTGPRADGGSVRWPFAYGAVALVVLVFFYPLVLGQVFVSPDSVAPAGFAKIALDAFEARGIYALWNPYHFLGMPSFGSLAFTPYVYPLDPLFGFLNRTLGFPDLTWLLFHYLLLGLGMVALLRSLGAGPEASALGAVTFALTPNLVAVGAFGHGSQIMTAAYLPLLFLLYGRFVRRGSLLALAGFAFAAAFQLLRAHVQIVFYTWLALGLYAAFLAWDAARAGRRAEAGRALGGLLGGLALGFGMSAFLYLPVQEYAKLSTRGGGEGGGAGLEYATSWSFHPREILTFVIPSMFGFGGRTYWGSMPFTDYPNYMGIVPLALAVFGLLRARGVSRAFWLALIGASLLISFGKHLKPLYALLYDHLPFFNKFRVPVMTLVLVQFAVGALAALGLDAATRREGRHGQERGGDGHGWLKAAGLTIAGAVGVVVVLQALRGGLETAAVHARVGYTPALAATAVDMAVQDALKSGLILAAAFAWIAIYRAARITKIALAAGLLFLTAADLWILDRKIIDPLLASPRQYEDEFRETPEVTFLRSDSTQFRVLPLEWNDSRLAAFGVASVLGYHPAKPRLYQAFVDTVGIPNSLATLQLLNVKYYLTAQAVPAGIPGLLLRHAGPVNVYEIEGALPRAFVAHRLLPVRDDGVALAMIRTNAFDPREEVLWTGPDPLRAMGRPGTPDSVRTLKYDFNEVEYSVMTESPGVFVTVEQWDPGWTATVDGNPAELRRVNFLMRGVLVEPGEHSVRYAYRPEALGLGRRISVASGAVALLIAAWGIGFKIVTRRNRARGAALAARPARAGEGAG